MFKLTIKMRIIYLIMSINKAFQGLFKSIADSLTALNAIYSSKIDAILKQMKTMKESKK